MSNPQTPDDLAHTLAWLFEIMGLIRCSVKARGIASCIVSGVNLYTQPSLAVSDGFIAIVKG